MRLKLDVYNRFDIRLFTIILKGNKDDIIPEYLIIRKRLEEKYKVK